MKAKKKATAAERHGSDWQKKPKNYPSPFSRPEVREKSKQTCLQRYGVSHPSSSRKKIVSKEKLSELYSSGMTTMEVGETLGLGRTWVETRMKEHGIQARKNGVQSRHERELHEVLKSAGIEFKTNDRSIIAPKELDVYVPSKELAVEINGLYWHSGDRIDKEYHRMKRLRCEEKGIHLIQVYDKEWDEKKDLLSSMILSKLGVGVSIGARTCEIVEVSSIEANNFLDDNHVQGGCRASVRLGLLHQGELVTLMTFGKPRFSKKHDYELIRLASKRGTQVSGGSERLLKEFKKRFPSSSIVSYCDSRFFSGSVYTRLGFTLKSDQLGFVYYNKATHQCLSRYACQKHKLPSILENFDPAMTEVENMQLNGYTRVWDAGQLVFHLT